MPFSRTLVVRATFAGLFFLVVFHFLYTSTSPMVPAWVPQFSNLLSGNSSGGLNSNLQAYILEKVQTASVSCDAVLTLLQTELRTKRFPCEDHLPKPHYGYRGQYWVLYNYFRGTKQFRCDESITYTTHADWTYLSNLIPLLERWQGPLQLAVYAPGKDFDEVVSRIQYLRECAGTTLIKELVTVHIFFDTNHFPKAVPAHPDLHPVDCASRFAKPPKFEGKTYKKQHELVYPVNLARNVAREMATTHFVFPSDIELYPSPGLIPKFLEMVERQKEVEAASPRVYVNAVFEVESKVKSLPQDKGELVEMLKNKSAILFHAHVCADCHRVPELQGWIEAEVTEDIGVFTVGKRVKPYQSWEPFYIGTKDEPLFDERLSWDGRKDKMAQAYILCLLDYEFHVLDNAFLVHKPGIKTMKKNPENNTHVPKQNALISDVLLPELKKLYGTRDGCRL